ncbi:UDP-N-acetylmuramoyl-tripeptide--D-alanyl-D-alanine ligase [Anaerovibrio sp.]|uniref:UDP-N-acetylmuramoyl-tripeptide--D-alanyl-D- alanine ligase n=1 Tax=Anaerovibrio sp. TaxID=1872532 RepID=UPI003F190126
MPAFTLDDVMHALQGGTVLEQVKAEFTDIVTDTRKIVPGALFVALKGERFNGEDFALQAVEQGAAGVLVSSEYGQQPGKLGATLIKADTDTQLAYQQLAAFWRRKFHIPVLAITGSNGKTTTKDMTAAVLSARFPVLKTQGNFNNEIGLPYTLLQMNDMHRAAVVEIGMRGLGQIAALAPFAAPEIGIVTNVGETHIELLGSLENIARAKAELVEAIPAGGTVILNNDNPYTAAMKDKAAEGVRVVTFGIDNDADIKAAALISHDGRTFFQCRIGDGGEQRQLSIPMLGRHNVSNALAAVAAGYVLGLTVEQIAEGLENLEMTGMRFECRRVGAYNIINDAYNASPMSMEASLSTLKELTIDKGKRSLAVLGDMLELGHVAVPAHQKVGQQAAAAGVCGLITLGEMGREIAGGAREAGLEAVYSFDTHEEAAAKLRELLQPEDTVLFKGSRGMKMETIIDLL